MRDIDRIRIVSSWMKDSEGLKKLVISRSKTVKFLIESKELFLGKEVLAAWNNIIKNSTTKGWEYGLNYLDPIKLDHIGRYLGIESLANITGYHYLCADNPYKETQIYDYTIFSTDEIDSMKNHIHLNNFPKIFTKLCSKESFDALEEKNPEFFNKLMQLCKENIELLNSFWEKIESISIFLLNKDITLKFLESNLPELYKYYDKV